MKPLQENEKLCLPERGQHACPNCGLWAKGAHDIDRVFGFRRHNYAARKDGTVRVDVMPWCKGCRNTNQGSQEIAPRQKGEFGATRGKHPGVVYLIFAVDLDLCKIGYTQVHPLGRLKTFQIGCPLQLEIVGYYGADYFGENEAQRAHHDQHVRGEWFSMTWREATDWIKANNGRVEVAQ